MLLFPPRRRSIHQPPHRLSSRQCDGLRWTVRRSTGLSHGHPHRLAANSVCGIPPTSRHYQFTGSGASRAMPGLRPHPNAPALAPPESLKILPALIAAWNHR
jgi:hypothetical protein